jgi:hypothetical protein
MAFATGYVLFQVDFYPGTPTPQMPLQSIQVCCDTPANAKAAVVAAYSGAVVVEVREASVAASSAILPAAVTGTTSPATMYMVTFYPQTADHAVNQLSMGVAANTIAGAWAIVVNYYATAVMLSITDMSAPPSSISLKSA